MKLTWGLIVFSGMVLLSLASAARAGDGDDAKARKLMEDAFNRRYHWPESLKCITAAFTYRHDDQTVKGTIKVDVTKAHGGVEVTCDDEAVKKMVQTTITSTVTHNRGSQFDKVFGECSFAFEDGGSRGGTKLKLTNHGFFKDFTIKDGNIIENHGGHGDMATEVKVHQVAWVAEIGKTLPRDYSFSITNGGKQQTGRTVESWQEVDGVWFPASFRMTRSEDGSTPVSSTLRLEDVHVEGGK